MKRKGGLGTVIGGEGKEEKGRWSGFGRKRLHDHSQDNIYIIGGTSRDGRERNGNGTCCGGILGRIIVKKVGQH